MGAGHGCWHSHLHQGLSDCRGNQRGNCLSRPSGDEVAFFQASYQSEGRNVLSTIRAGWKPLSFAESDDELETLAGAFASEVDAEVANTYAMRLAASQA